MHVNSFSLPAPALIGEVLLKKIKNTDFRGLERYRKEKYEPLLFGVQTGSELYFAVRNSGTEQKKWFQSLVRTD
jgi:hypothetical protein